MAENGQAPYALWAVQRAIEGVAHALWWEGESERPTCPRIWEKVD